MKQFDIRDMDIFLAANEYLKHTLSPSAISFHVFHLTGTEILDLESADEWLKAYYGKISGDNYDYENDKELDQIIEHRKSVLTAIKNGRITVNA